MIEWTVGNEILIAETNKRIFAKVIKQRSGLYLGEIIEWFSHGEEKIAEKKDNSLIELINWVEEELKFRTKNGNIH